MAEKETDQPSDTEHQESKEVMDNFLDMLGETEKIDRGWEKLFCGSVTIELSLIEFSDNELTDQNKKELYLEYATLLDNRSIAIRTHLADHPDKELALAYAQTYTERAKECRDSVRALEQKKLLSQNTESNQALTKLLAELLGGKDKHSDDKKEGEIDPQTN